MIGNLSKWNVKLNVMQMSIVYSYISLLNHHTGIKYGAWHRHSACRHIITIARHSLLPCLHHLYFIFLYFYNYMYTFIIWCFCTNVLSYIIRVYVSSIKTGHIECRSWINMISHLMYLQKTCQIVTFAKIMRAWM